MATREHLTCEAVAAKLREFHGNMAAAARALSVTRGAVFLYVHRHPTLKDVVRECRESMKDHAESSLHRALLAGEAWAVCFFLKCQAKDRGYVERQEYKWAEEDEAADRALDAELARLAAARQGAGAAED
jgi:hypothetical protein